jgi:hypothetical protein
MIDAKTPLHVNEACLVVWMLRIYHVRMIDCHLIALLDADGWVTCESPLFNY